MIFLNKTGKYISLQGHYPKRFFGLGIGGEKFTGCDDEYTKKYKCVNIKIFLGPLIFNILIRGLGKKVPLPL